MIVNRQKKYDVKIYESIKDNYKSQALLGYNMTLRVAPIALEGRLGENLATTTPFSPWALAMRPQIVLNLLPWGLLVAL